MSSLPITMWSSSAGPSLNYTGMTEQQLTIKEPKFSRKIYRSIRYFLVQSLIHVWLSVTPRTAAHQVSLSFTISQNLLKLMSTESVMPFNPPGKLNSLPMSDSGGSRNLRQVTWPQSPCFLLLCSMVLPFSGEPLVIHGVIFPRVSVEMTVYISIWV